LIDQNGFATKQLANMPGLDYIVAGKPR